jgi:hypothetical protein
MFNAPEKEYGFQSNNLAAWCSASDHFFAALLPFLAMPAQLVAF